jgi:hypothetical protein
MAGKLLILISLIAAASPVLHAEERPPVDPLADGASKRERTGPPPPPGMRRPGFNRGGDEEKTRQALQQLSPEERQRFFRRLKEFADLPPEKKKELFERGEYFRRKMREDVEAAMRQTGLELTEEQKRKFSERYFEERKAIEEDLRKQMEELRKPRLQALAEKLKQEFAAQSGTAPK